MMTDVLWEGKYFVVYTWVNSMGYRYVVMTNKMNKQYIKAAGIQPYPITIANQYVMYMFIDPNDNSIKLVDLVMEDTAENRAELIEQAKREEYYTMKKLEKVRV